jgi:ankyrin repeat protein
MTNDVPTALIGAGADVNNLDSVGSTPLRHAASVDFGDTEMVRLLLAGWRENGSAFLARVLAFVDGE